MALMRVTSASVARRGPRAAGATEAPDATVAAAASTAGGTRPDAAFVFGGVFVVVVGLSVSGYVNDLVDPRAFKPAQGISVFALLYVLAQGLERFMEPLPRGWGAPSPRRLRGIRRSQRH